jgi:hypothetical protein
MLVILAGFLLPLKPASTTPGTAGQGSLSETVEMAMFFQTAMFVIFNKVCTSQVSGVELLNCFTLAEFRGVSLLDYSATATSSVALTLTLALAPGRKHQSHA